MSRKSQRRGRPSSPPPPPDPPRRSGRRSAAGGGPPPPRRPARGAAPRLDRRVVFAAASVAVLGLIGYATAWAARYWHGHRPIPGPPPAAAVPKVTHADFTGSETCAACHAKEYAAWRSSTHGHAGGAPDSVTLIAPFDGRPIRFADATVTPSVSSSGAHQFTIEQEGEATRVLTVAGVVGGGYLNGGGTQGFFTRFTDGSVRFMPFDFSRAANAWICITSGHGWQPITPALRLADCGDWPPARILGSLADQATCQQCHGSQITITATGSAPKYRTEYTSLRINCESCHGPGRRHVALMRGGAAPGTEIGMRALATLPPDSASAICWQCHSLKQELQPGYLPGDPFETYWSLLLPTLIAAPYFPDGRVRTFAYQLNQIASPCWFNGAMTCTACHAPHSQTYRDINGTALSGRFDDRQCTDCHASQGLAAAAHTHHPATSSGSRCTACHMPYLQEPWVGSAVRFARSDHTISIPRPTLDGAFGITGACRQCHATMTAAAAGRQIDAWWGPVKPVQDVVGGLVASVRSNDPAQVAEMVLHPESRNRLVQFQGMSHYFIHFITPDMKTLPPVAVDRLEQLAGSPDDDVAALALASLHLALGSRPDVRGFLIRTVAGLGARDDAVRRRWVMIYQIRGGAYNITNDPRGAALVRQKLHEIDPGATF